MDVWMGDGWIMAMARWIDDVWDGGSDDGWSNG